MPLPYSKIIIYLPCTTCFFMLLRAYEKSFITDGFEHLGKIKKLGTAGNMKNKDLRIKGKRPFLSSDINNHCQRDNRDPGICVHRHDTSLFAIWNALECFQCSLETFSMPFFSFFLLLLILRISCEVVNIFLTHKFAYRDMFGART